MSATPKTEGPKDEPTPEPRPEPEPSAVDAAPSSSTQDATEPESSDSTQAATEPEPQAAAGAEGGAAKGEGDEAGQIVAVSRGRRHGMYWLISLHSLTVYIVRACVPYIVPYLVRDFGFSDAQRAMMLNSFTPGYLLTMIPGGALATWTGAKPMLTATGLLTGVIILLLPTAARIGHLPLCAAIGLTGAMNGPFLPAHYACASPARGRRFLAAPLSHPSHPLSQPLSASAASRATGRRATRRAPSRSSS